MASISSSMASAAQAMQVLQRSVAVVENNIANASVANYARQDQVILANPFLPASSSQGGISAGPVRSSRNAAAEAFVWRRQTAGGHSSQMQATLRTLQQSFPVGQGAGIPAAMDSFFASASRLSMSPNSTDARQDLIHHAATVARSFNQTAAEVSSLTGAIGAEISPTVNAINRLGAEIASINAAKGNGSAVDAGLDARLHSALEELASYTAFSAIPNKDGGMVVSLGGDVPLVIGGRHLPLTVAPQSGQVSVLDAQGNDVTSRLSGGKLGALLDARNRVLPSFSAQLDTLAQTFADEVNATLAGGLDRNGMPPVQDLFSYDPSLGAAASLRTNDLAPDEIAAAGAADPGGNSNANRLAQLSSTAVAGGGTLTGMYGAIASDLGRQLSDQTARVDSDQQLLLQAQSFRQEISGVSIDAEALKLLDLQRGFEAVGRVIQVLDELSETVLNMLR